MTTGTSRALRATLALSLVLAGAPMRAQVENGSGVRSFNHRRGDITIEPSDLPVVQVLSIGTGDGSTLTFALPIAVDPTRLAVSVGGVQQDATAFAATATSITFAALPPAGASIMAALGALPAAPVVLGAPQTYPTILADGTMTSFLLSPAPANPSRYSVRIGGVVQSRTSCQLLASALVCDAPPPAGASIVVEDGP